mgnify:CR=1 FL=1
MHLKSGPAIRQIIIVSMIELITFRTLLDDTNGVKAPKVNTLNEVRNYAAEKAAVNAANKCS